MDKNMSNMLAMWNAGVEAVRPYPMVKKFLAEAWSPETKTLAFNAGVEVALDNNLFVVGFGKAALAMAEPIYEVLGDHIRKGVLSVPIGATANVTWTNGKEVIVREGGEFNLPDRAALYTTRMIASLVRGMDENHVLIVLISGGGSALLSLPVEGISLFAKTTLIRNLASSGATIQEINVVRQCLSRVKGGGLAQMAAPAKVLSLILSDVIGDPLELIASGPTVICEKDYEKAAEIVERKLSHIARPPNVLSYLLNKSTEVVATDAQEPFKPPSPPREILVNNIIGSNQVALRGCRRAAKKLGIKAFIVSPVINGEASDMARFCAELARVVITDDLASVDKTLRWMTPSGMASGQVDVVLKFLKAHEPNPRCLIFGGETTVEVVGRGRGGRNQEMALHFACEAAKLPAKSCIFLSAGTDGIDGPTDAAGAFGYPGMFDEPGGWDLNPDSFLKRNDSNTYYANLDAGSKIIRTGHTGTNVMDIQILLFP